MNSFRGAPLPAAWQEHVRCELTRWRIPNQLFDLSSRFLNVPAVDSYIKSDIVFSPHFNILHTRRTPRVVTFHDLSFLHHPDFFRARQNFWHWRQAYAEQARNASRIIAVSEFTKSDLVEKLHIPEEKIRVIYSGIDERLRRVPQSDTEYQDFIRAHSLDFPFILYLGTLEPRKNVEALVRAFSLLKQKQSFRDYRLIIAGRPGWLYGRTKRAAQTSPYRDHIIFWGEVLFNHKIFLYNLASAFVYPSFFEGFGFPPLEAQRCGTPVIVSDRTSLPEILTDSALYVNPWDVRALTEHLALLLIDDTLRHSLIKKGLTNSARFSWTRTTDATLALFNECTS
jgi:glycosyltransferase involved in cell wall biosynthesis